MIQTISNFQWCNCCDD